MVGWITLWGCGMSSVLQNDLQHPRLPPLETSSAPPAITTAKMLPSVLYQQNHHRVKTCHTPCQLHTFSNNTHKLNHITVGRWQWSRGIRGYLLSCVCHNKWSQTWWLKVRECSGVLEPAVRSKGVGGATFPLKAESCREESFSVLPAPGDARCSLAVLCWG